MVHVQVTPHLLRRFPALEDVHVVAGTVAEVIARLEELHPGLAGHVVDASGALLDHVQVFVGSEQVRDRAALSDPVGDGDDVYVVPAREGRAG